MSKLNAKLQAYLDEIEDAEIKSVILASRDCLNDSSVERLAELYLRLAERYLVQQMQYDEAKRIIGELRVQVQSAGMR